MNTNKTTLKATLKQLLDKLSSKKKIRYIAYGLTVICLCIMSYSVGCYTQIGRENKAEIKEFRAQLELVQSLAKDDSYTFDPHTLVVWQEALDAYRQAPGLSSLKKEVDDTQKALERLKARSVSTNSN